MRPVITDFMSLTAPTTFCTRIDDALIVVQDDKIIVSSPQNINRATSGLQHYYYQHSGQIIDATGICMDGSIAYECLPDNDKEQIELPMHNEKQILFLDVRKRFYLYDTNRAFISSVFTLPKNAKILSFCGSDTVPKEFAVLGNDGFLTVYEIMKNECMIKSAIRVEKGSKVLPLSGSYLIQTDDKIILYKDGSLKDFYTIDVSSDEKKKRFISDFKVDKGRVIVASNAACEGCILSIVGTTTFGIHKWRGPAFWDVHDGWITAYLKNDLLAFINVENPDMKQLVNLSGMPYQKITKIASGNARYGEKYSVTLIFDTNIALINVPFPILTGKVKCEPIDERMRESAMYIRTTKKQGK